MSNYSNNIIVDPAITDVEHTTMDAGLGETDCIVFTYNNKKIHVVRNQFWDSIELRIVGDEMFELTKSFRDSLEDTSESALLYKIHLTKVYRNLLIKEIYGEAFSEELLKT
jgi:hypothetical protein